MKAPPSSSIARMVTRRYIFALVLLALLITGNFALMRYTIMQQQGDAAIINLSGRQRMLTQKTALLATQLVSTESTRERERLRQLLLDTASRLEHAHNVLLDGDAVLSIPAPTPALRQSLYFSPPEHLHQQIQNFLKHTRNLVSEAQGASAESPAYLHLMTAAESRLLEALNDAVAVYEHESRSKLETLKRLESLVAVITLLALALEALLIFTPMVRQIERVQQRLENVNRLKSEFIANMSHEIRTPMNGIFGMSELLMESNLNADQRRYVQTLLSSADSLLGIIDDVLDFSKIEAGKLTLDPLLFDLQSALEDVADLLAPQALEKKIDLMVRYSPDTPRYIVGDPGRIRQIVTNLLGNALKFTDDGFVMIHAELANNTEETSDTITLKISVEDTGIGIDAAQQASIFEKFSQADTSTTREYGGTGLGLAICRQLAQLMEGSIGVNSAPGEGSTFWFTVRLGRAPASTTLTVPETLAGRKILVVDDIGANRKLLGEQLGRAGMVVDFASSGSEALAMLDRAQRDGRLHDMVVSDYMMPYMDGEHLTRRIRASEPLQHLPVIILTSAGEKGMAQTFTSAGVSAYAAKPVRSDRLLDMLAQVWQRHCNGETSTPLTLHTAAALQAQALLESQTQPLQGVRILLVEDNRTNREFASELLETMGCVVLQAENGRIAVDMMKSDTFDLVFMDCQMPVMDGFEASRLISNMKSSGKIPDTPVIALTANAMSGDRERCLRAGMNDYLSKPILRNKLEMMLLKWLEEPITANRRAFDAASNTASANTQPSAEPAALPPPPIQEKTIMKAMENIPTAALDAVLDRATMDEVRSLMGARFTQMMRYYLEDGVDHLAQLHAALEADDLQALIIPSHSLKSASRQFGLPEVAETAAAIEGAAQHALQRQESRIDASLRQQLPRLEQAFYRARPFVEEELQLPA